MAVLVTAIHVFSHGRKGVDGRDKPGHDEGRGRVHEGRTTRITNPHSVRSAVVMRSSLGKHVAPALADEEQLEAMRRAAWQQQGIAVLDPARIADEWTRQAIVNEAERRYGKRRAP